MATETKSFEDRVKELATKVDAMYGSPNPFNEDRTRPQKRVISKTLKLEIGVLLRGHVRKELALHTSLEVTEVKGFFESVFILKATNEKQFRELARVQAWIRTIAADD